MTIFSEGNGRDTANHFSASFEAENRLISAQQKHSTAMGTIFSNVLAAIVVTCK